MTASERSISGHQRQAERCVDPPADWVYVEPILQDAPMMSFK